MPGVHREKSRHECFRCKDGALGLRLWSTFLSGFASETSKDVEARCKRERQPQPPFSTWKPEEPTRRWATSAHRVPLGAQEQNSCCVWHIQAASCCANFGSFTFRTLDGASGSERPVLSASLSGWVLVWFLCPSLDLSVDTSTTTGPQHQETLAAASPGQPVAMATKLNSIWGLYRPFSFRLDANMLHICHLKLLHI